MSFRINNGTHYQRGIKQLLTYLYKQVVHAQAADMEHKVPEPLFETTFTLLDRVTYSRIRRGLGGLIFLPRPQPKKTRKEVEDGWQRRKTAKTSHQSLHIHEIKYRLVATSVSVSVEGCSANTTASKHTHNCINICRSTSEHMYLDTHTYTPFSTFPPGVFLVTIFFHDSN